MYDSAMSTMCLGTRNRYCGGIEILFFHISLQAARTALALFLTLQLTSNLNVLI